MLIVKKNVYYCEHCNKKGLVAMHIRKHEARCTNNPHRFCGVCEYGNATATIVELFKKRFELIDNLAVPEYGDIYNPEANNDEKIVKWIGEPVTLQDVRNTVDNFPACILAILRQTGFNRHYFHFDKFDFKTELKAWLADQGIPKSAYL